MTTIQQIIEIGFALLKLGVMILANLFLYYLVIFAIWGAVKTSYDFVTHKTKKQ